MGKDFSQNKRLGEIMHWTSIESVELKKSKQAEAVAAKTAEFLKRGGKITKIPNGVSGLGDNPMRVPILQGRKK